MSPGVRFDSPELPIHELCVLRYRYLMRSHLRLAFNSRTAFGLLLAALVIGVVVWVGDPKSLEQLKDVRPAPAILVVVATGLLVFVSAWRWRLVLSGLDPGSEYPLFSLFRVIGLGLALGMFVQQDIGLAASRLTYLSRGGHMPIERASYSVFLDRWLDLVILAVAAPASALFVGGLIGSGLAIGITLALVVVLLVVSLARPGAITALFSIGFAATVSVVRKIVRRSLPGISATGEGPFQELTGRQLTYIMALSLVRLTVVGVRTWLVVLALGIDLNVLTTFLLVPMAQLALLILLTPGGLGTYDGGWYGLLLLQDVSAGESLAFIVMLRVLVGVSLLLTAGVGEIGWRLRSSGGAPEQ